MKYLFFWIAVIGILPLTAILVMWRKSMHYAVLGLLLPIMIFQETAINFFSNEWYKGTSRGMEVSIIYLIALAILLACTIRCFFLNPLPDIGSWIYLLYFILSLLSFRNAADRLISFLELWKMIMMHLVYLSIYYYIKNEKDVKIIFRTGFGIFTIVAFFMIIRQHFGGLVQVRMFFPHQNSAAMFMVPVGIIFMSLYLTSEKIKDLRCYLLLFIMASACVLRTYSRGAMACYPIGCAITTALCLMFNFKVNKFVKLLPIFVFGLLGVLLISHRIIQRFQNAPESSKLNRIDLATRAKNMIIDKPYFGVGLNNWGIKVRYPYEYLGIEGVPPREFDKPKGIVETIYLLVAAECGIPALVVLVLWFLYYWILAIRLLFKLRRTPYFWLPAGLVGGLTSIYLQSALEWVLKQQLNFIQLMICFASLAALNTMAKKTGRRYGQSNITGAATKSLPKTSDSKESIGLMNPKAQATDTSIIVNTVQKNAENNQSEIIATGTNFENQGA